MKYTSIEAISAVMAAKGETNASLGKRIGKTSAAMWDRLNKKNVGVPLMVEMARAMNYKVLLVPDDKPVREGEYELK
jgi:hypothetical protein